MRAPALLVFFIGSAATSAVFFAAACSTGSTAPPQEAIGTTADPVDTGSTVSIDPPPSNGGPEPGATAPYDGEPQSDIANAPPDGGVVMNNATTSEDAGGSDRMKPIMDIIAKNRDKYRACFDAWAVKNKPADAKKITLTIKLAPTGAVERVAFKADETDVTDASIEGCMAEVTKKLTFPSSPSEKITTYNHRFVFKPRK